MKGFFTALIIFLLIGGGLFYYFYGRQGLTGNNILVKGIISLTSPNFSTGGHIPQKYTCDGANVNPTLDIDRVPSDAKSLVIIVIDVNSLSKNFTHWLVYNIHPDVTRIDENTIPPGGVAAKNDYGKREYDGPCPPLGSHLYYFRIYAINTILSVDETLDRPTLDNLIKGHIIAKGETFGEYLKN